MSKVNLGANQNMSACVSIAARVAALAAIAGAIRRITNPLEAFEEMVASALSGAASSRVQTHVSPGSSASSRTAERGFQPLSATTFARSDDSEPEPFDPDVLEASLAQVAEHPCMVA